MQILGRLSQLLGRRTETAGEQERQLLEPAEIRMIASGDTARLSHFAASRRLHAVDPKGDTPLHVAARLGNLALCDLFVRAGADPSSHNHENQTPADVAFAEGHRLAAQLLVSLLRNSEEVPSREARADLPHADAEARVERTVRSFPTQPPPLERPEEPIALDDLLTFEPVEDAETFYGRSAGESASGTFIAFVSTVPTDPSDTDGDWKVDLSPTWIGGDGIASKATILPDNGGEKDFLRVRNSGRQSVKRAVVQSSTRLSIDPGTCVTWAADVLAKRSFRSDDVETLISFCEGNGDPDELRTNLQRTLEAAGLESFETTESVNVLWDIRSDVSDNDLAEAIEASFSRAVRLPGTRRFDMDKSSEARLLDPMVLAKQELLLGILACEPALETILKMIDQLLDGSIASSFVTMRTIVPSRPEHAETGEFLEAVEALKSWNSTGRVMDGRRRRKAFESLEALDLTLMFYRAMVESLTVQELHLDDSLRLDGLISVFEMAIERLILEHLPYARRFSARNVEEGEDPEDVFQVAFMGLQRSTRRFDPERGHRFIVYSTFWMKQALTRWRADEGALIRIPVHRHERLADFDRAVERFEARSDRSPTAADLVTELGWDKGEVERLLRIPRHHLEQWELEEREDAIAKPDQEVAFDHAEMTRIISDAIAELPERQAAVIRMRFGIGRDDEMTLEEIGQIYGVTRERIRQIEAKGLSYLAHPGRIRDLKLRLGM